MEVKKARAILMKEGKIAVVKSERSGAYMLPGGRVEKGEEEIEEVKKLSFAVLMLQGIATSIDALSVGFTIADYGFVMALVCSIIIAAVTFVICETGLYLGKTLGTKLAGKADVLGGVILTGIGIEIFVKGVFF